MKCFSTTDFDDYLATILRESVTKNGVFGMKVVIEDILPCVEALERHGIVGNSAFIYLTRDDIAAQAVSHFIALESGVWHRDRSGKTLGSGAITDVAAVEFEEEKISVVAGELIDMQESWEEFFASYRIDPLRLSYEDLYSDADSVVKAVARHVGIDWAGTVSLDRAETSLLRDKRSTEWADRIRARMPQLEGGAGKRRSHPG